MNRSVEKNNLRLGWISLLNDLGSEVLTRLIPFYVSIVLGAPMSAVGAIEGIAESSATLLKPVFGSISDRLGKRKVFVIWGYGLSALARPFLAMAGSWPEVAFLRFCDRLGKGVRTAPRDALIADSSIASNHGRSFGLNRALDTLGALIGVSIFAFWAYQRGENSLTASSWKGLVWVCAVPGIFALLLSIYGIQEVFQNRAKAADPSQKLGPLFKHYLVVVGLFSLANSSDAFILLRAKDLGYSLAEILAMIALLNVVSAMTAIPAAALSDRLGRRTLIAMGWTIYAGAYAFMGSEIPSRSRFAFAAIIAVYGLFFGFTESVERAWIADLAPAHLRGRAYGAFGFVVGVAALPASLGFGFLWDHYGSAVPFLASSAIAMFATALLFVMI